MLARPRGLRMRRSRRDLAIAPPGRRIGGPRKLASLKEIATNAPTRAPCAHAIWICCQACRVFEGSRTQRTHGCVDLAEIFPSRLLDMPSADLAKSRPVSTAATKSRPRCALHDATLHYTRDYPTLHCTTSHDTTLHYRTPHHTSFCLLGRGGVRWKPAHHGHHQELAGDGRVCRIS